MRVLVTGSRGWTSPHAIRARLYDLRAEDRNLVVVCGGARGPDRAAEDAARDFGLRCEVWEADWERYGKKAGPIRNLGMLNSGVDLVLAFWDGESRGTQHCISAARVKGIPVEVISPT